MKRIKTVISRLGVLAARLAALGLLTLSTHWFAQDAWQTAPTANTSPAAAIQCFTAAITSGITGWLLCIHLACAATQIPGAVGATAHTLVERSTPATMRRLAALTLATTAWAPQAHASTPGPGPGPGPAGIVATAPSTHRSTAVELPLPDPGLRPRHRTLDQAGRMKSVTVRPGDTLWQIAAHHLGDQATPAQIAVEWPRWLAANRTELTDPSSLRPGQTLIAPLSPKAPR
ncbi:LysM peptidoglycan-binding domain-containing protein [Austwickia chelonae]|uniref:LysM domain-containing protein n=1 Tax=Austwickia chelonae NBRC 105200 TaxID=1184607 RepID=K6W947_9MICO|nr:LysM domain-containing protein [Austwickia chelonae]GAB78357.1 hypothetical protein AUCHE_08_06040 [Austwickia chelonae NBRC 105200]